MRTVCCTAQWSCVTLLIGYVPGAHLTSAKLSRHHAEHFYLRLRVLHVQYRHFQILSDYKVHIREFAICRPKSKQPATAAPSQWKSHASQITSTSASVASAGDMQLLGHTTTPQKSMSSRRKAHRPRSTSGATERSNSTFVMNAAASSFGGHMRKAIISLTVSVSTRG